MLLLLLRCQLSSSNTSRKYAKNFYIVVEDAAHSVIKNVFVSNMSQIVSRAFYTLYSRRQGGRAPIAYGAITDRREPLVTGFLRM